MKHSPLPWKIATSDGYFYYINDADDNQIFKIPINPEDASVHNVHLLVLACNNFYEMQRLIQEISESDPCEILGEWHAEAKHILARLEEE